MTWSPRIKQPFHVSWTTNDRRCVMQRRGTIDNPTDHVLRGIEMPPGVVMPDVEGPVP